MRLGDEIKDFFHFNRGERNGIAILMAILGCVAIFYFVQPYLVTEEPPNEDERKEIEAFLASAKRKEKEKEEYNSKDDKSFFENERKKREPEFFPFDPNGLPAEQWQRMGLSEAQARVIKNYEKAGATFEVKEDVLNLFPIDSALYEKMKPYIQLPDSLPKQRFESAFEDSSFYQKPEQVKVIHLNKADTTELMKVKGIGPYYAGKIVELREELGGYYKADQLLEIWNFDTTTFESMEPIVSIDTTLITKLDINSVTKEELQAHPYIDWKFANAIVKYREQHGKYSTVDDLLQIAILKEEDLKKLRPYLKTE